MKNYGSEISTLFGSLNTTNSLGFSLSDYASIKNGSYGKLIKSYYAEQKSTSSTEKTSSDNSTEKTAVVDNTGLSQMKKNADGLKTASEALNSDDIWKQTNGEYDMDKITSAVKTFVNEYNDTIKQSDKVSSQMVSQDIKYMSSLTSTMSKALSKAGITVGTDGKLSLNEDTLKKANVSDVKSLFTGKVSYGSQITDKASEISKDAVMSSGIYGNNGLLSSSLSGLFNTTV